MATLAYDGEYSVVEAPIFCEVGDFEDVGGSFEDGVSAHTQRTRYRSM
jgi:hypothetical protein